MKRRFVPEWMSFIENCKVGRVSGRENRTLNLYLYVTSACLCKPFVYYRNYNAFV